MDKRAFLGGLLAIAAGSCMTVAQAQVSVHIRAPAPPVPHIEIVQVAPPAPRIERMPVPRHGHVWVPGNWDWNGRAYIWRTGTWEPERQGYRRRPDRWVQHSGGWMRERGGWDQDHDRGRGHGHGHGHDRDHDGVPDRYDDHPNNPHRR